MVSDVHEMPKDPPRWYGVSFGDGNDGVSHMFPNYYVFTDMPYDLARIALIASFREEYQQKAADELDMNGEAEFTISAVIHDPMDWEPEEGDEEGYPYAAYICEVFPVEEEEIKNTIPGHGSLEACFTAEELKWAEDL